MIDFTKHKRQLTIQEARFARTNYREPLSQTYPMAENIKAKVHSRIVHPVTTHPRATLGKTSGRVCVP